MTTNEREQEIIEVEVVEIDGVAPVPSTAEKEKQPKPSAPFDWQKWYGRIRKLDARWWPLWVVLGVIALFLLLTVGVILGAIYLVYRIISNLLSGIVEAFR